MKKLSFILINMLLLLLSACISSNTLSNTPSSQSDTFVTDTLNQQNNSSITGVSLEEMGYMLYLDTDYYNKIGRPLEIEPSINEKGMRDEKGKGIYTLIQALSDESTIDMNYHPMFCLQAFSAQAVNGNTTFTIFDKQYTFNQVKEKIVYNDEAVIILDVISLYEPKKLEPWETYYYNLNLSEYKNFLSYVDNLNEAERVKPSAPEEVLGTSDIGVMGVRNYNYNFLKDIYRYIYTNFNTLIIKTKDIPIEISKNRNVVVVPRKEDDERSARLQNAFFAGNEYDRIYNIIKNTTKANTNITKTNEYMYIYFCENEHYRYYDVYSNDLIYEINGKCWYFSKGCYDKLIKEYKNKMG